MNNYYNKLQGIVKPPLRAVKYQCLYWLAKQKCLYRQTKNDNQPIAFIIGCGRSGTTILGNILSQHSQISYFFEPYHLWANIDMQTDVLNLYHSGDASLLMNASNVSKASRKRFNQLFQPKFHNQLVLEKTPLNALRLGYLNTIAPKAKFIHLVRDGVDVSHSIARLAITNRYQITGKPNLNQWWGVNHSKWNALVRDGVKAGYYSDEISSLQTETSKGAYEWLVTLNEVNRWKSALKERFLELSYETLITNPESTLKQLFQFLEINVSSEWLQQSTYTIDINRHSRNDSMNLPLKMCQDFNEYQQQYGFTKRATSNKSN